MDADDLRNDVSRLALPLLVERLGGVVELTEDELDAFAARHGGLRNVGVKIEKAKAGLRLTIIHVERPPSN